jgi:hypothetical protein
MAHLRSEVLDVLLILDGGVSGHRRVGRGVLCRDDGVVLREVDGDHVLVGRRGTPDRPLLLAPAAVVANRDEQKQSQHAANDAFVSRRTSAARATARACAGVLGARGGGGKGTADDGASVVVCHVGCADCDGHQHSCPVP